MFCVVGLVFLFLYETCVGCIHLFNCESLIYEIKDMSVRMCVRLHLSVCFHDYVHVLRRVWPGESLHLTTE